MIYTEEQMKIIIKAYEKNGIVTRGDCIGLNSRPYADEVFSELKRRGYTEAAMSEPHLNNYTDYSRVIFNSDKYDYKEADEYMIQNILINT
jgi:hypothetical protein